MVNCNPETVSTDYDIIGPALLRAAHSRGRPGGRARGRCAGPVAGVVVQLGGQTPLGLAQALAAAGVPVVGTSPQAIHLAEDAARSGRCSRRPACRRRSTAPRPRSTRPATSRPRSATRSWSVPRTSWAGAAWRSSTTRSRCARTSSGPPTPAPNTPCSSTVLDDAVEIDVDALFDGSQLYLGGVMEHIEEAGIHSGDSACAAADHAGPGGARSDPGVDGGDRPRHRGPRSAERAVRADR